MSYNYEAKIDEIYSCPNYLRKDKLATSQNENEPKRTIRTLIDADFDVSEGFRSTGIYKFSVISNSKNGQEKEVLWTSSSKFSKSGFQYKIDSKSDKVNIAFDSKEDDWEVRDAIRNSVEIQKSYRETNANNLRDLDFLYEEYLFPSLRKIIGKQVGKTDKEISDIDVINFLNNPYMDDKISYFITDIVDIYNQSYLKHKEEISDDYNAVGYSQAHHRYNVCINDEDFKKNMENRISILETSINSMELTKKNIREDKNESLLDYINIMEKNLNNISDELLYRTGINGGSTSSSGFKSRKEAIKECKSTCDSYTKNGLITIDEKKKIDEYKNKILRGQMSKEDIKEYNELVGTINKRYKDYLKQFERRAEDLSHNGITNYDAARQRTKEGIDDIHGYIDAMQMDIRNIMLNQSDEMDARRVLAQNQALEKEVARHGTYNEETGEILLDTEKKALIGKIMSLSSLNSQELKMSQINSLIENDIPSLLNIVYKTEALSGLKDFYLSDFQEDDRQALFGEHYHYLSADQFFDKINEIITERDNSKTQTINPVELASTVSGSLLTMSGSKYRNEFKQVLSTLKEIDALKLEQYLPTSDNEEQNRENVQKLILEATKKTEQNPIYESKEFEKLLTDSLKEGYNIYLQKSKKNMAEMESNIVRNSLYDKINTTLTHKVSNMKILSYDIEKQLGVEPKTLLTEDGSKLDIKKILELRQKLVQDYNAKVNKLSPEALPSEKVEVSEQARKIVFLEEKLLNYKVERDPETLAVSGKDKMAYDVLSSANGIYKEYEKNTDIKDSQKEIDSLQKKIQTKQERIEELEDDISKGHKFRLKSKQNELAKLQSEVKELQTKLNTEKEKISQVNDKLIASLQNDIAKKLELTLESNNRLEAIKKESNIVAKNIQPDIENLKSVIATVNSRYTNNDNDSIKKFVVVLAAIKEYPKEEVIERVNAKTGTEGDFLLKVINKEFSGFNEKDKKEITEAIQEVYTRFSELKASESVSVEGFRVGIDNVLKNQYNLVPLDVNGSNDLYNMMTNGEVPYKLKITNENDKNSTFISSTKVTLLKYYLQNNCSLDSTDEAVRNEVLLNFYKGQNNVSNDKIEETIKNIENNFNDMMSMIAPSENEQIKLNIHPQITNEGKNAILSTINAYGDTKNILIGMDTDKLKFSKTQMFTLDSSNGDNNSLNIAFDKTVDISDLKNLITEKAKEFNLPKDEKVTAEKAEEDYTFNFNREEITNAPTLMNALLKLTEDKNNENVKEELKNFLSKDDSTLFLTPEDFDRFMDRNNVKAEKKLEIVQSLQDVLYDKTDNENVKNIMDNLTTIEENLIAAEKEKERQEAIERMKPSNIKDRIFSKVGETFYKVSGKEKDDALTVMEVIDEIRTNYTNGDFSRDEQKRISNLIDSIKKDTDLSNKEKIEKLTDLKEQVEEISEETGTDRNKKLENIANHNSDIEL